MKTTIYESTLSSVVATKEAWGLSVVFYGNCEVETTPAAKVIIDWFETVREQYVYFDFRNTLSIDDGTIGLLLLIKQVGLKKGINTAVICAQNDANKITTAFYNISLSCSVRLYKSPHTFVLEAMGQKAPSRGASS